ncbi:MAG: hypothetical protein KatS3mg103_1350 [Phycisphaerales bacterium]|nr:MAG: hypothetical protein KatS3mg103_1350 [Phycisphaerales bacterium]
MRLTLEAIVRLAHPVMPFITETLAGHLAEHPLPRLDGLDLQPPRRGGVLATAGWPKADRALRDDEALSRFEMARALVGVVREVRARHNVKPRRLITLHAPPELVEALQPVAGQVCTLAELETITADAPTDPHAVACTYEGWQLRLANLAEAVDAQAERQRLEDQIAELERSRLTLQRRLDNPGYTEKAPAALVQQTREQLERVKQELATARQALERLH